MRGFVRITFAPRKSCISHFCVMFTRHKLGHDRPDPPTKDPGGRFGCGERIMSRQGAPPVERQASESMDIPERRVVIKDPSDLPTSYCQTPGGTIFSTTPGGTRIIYDRHFLLQMKNSPLSRTPPVKLAAIPDIIGEGVTIPNGKSSDLANTSANMKDNQNQSPNLDNSESGVFSMD